MLVGERMTRNPVTILETDSIDDGLQIMRERKVRRLPVLDASGKMVGIVSDKDLLHANWPELDAAVAAATRRDIGDRWAWGRRGEGDISMLEAATVALWAQDNARTRSVVDQRLAEGRPAVMSV